MSYNLTHLNDKLVLFHSKDHLYHTRFLLSLWGWMVSHTWICIDRQAYFLDYECGRWEMLSLVVCRTSRLMCRQNKRRQKTFNILIDKHREEKNKLKRNANFSLNWVLIPNVYHNLFSYSIFCREENLRNSYSQSSQIYSTKKKLLIKNKDGYFVVIIRKQILFGNQSAS